MEKQKYQEKIAALEQSISNLTKKADVKEKCVSTLYIVGGVMPLILGLGLWLWSPKILQKKEDEDKRDWTKFAAAIGGLTLLSWGGLYAYSCYGGAGEVCAK